MTKYAQVDLKCLAKGLKEKYLGTKNTKLEVKKNLAAKKSNL